MRRAALTMLLLLAGAMPAQAAQEAGQVLFVAGSVTAERTDTVELKKGDSVFEQDVIVTAARSRGQLLMRDGARFALRPETRFVVREYFLAGDERVQPDGSVVVTSDDSAVTGLIKGGFRTITGAIGKEKPEDYVVDTPAATMGIRGTHYTVVWCEGDCEPPPGIGKTEAIRDGLYVGVTDGIVVITNLTGDYTLEAGGFVYVRDRSTPPVRLTRMPAVLIDTYPSEKSDEERAAREMFQAIAAVPTPSGGSTFDSSKTRPTAPRPQPSGGKTEDAPGDDADATGFEPDRRNDGSTAGFEGEPDIPILTGDGDDLTGGVVPVRRPVAMAVGSLPGFDPAFTSSSRRGLRTFAANDLTAFQAPPDSTGTGTTYAIGTALIRDDGFDPATGIGWGRWTGGLAAVTRPDGSTVGADLAAQSLHWVYGPLAGSTAVPITGTASFTLIAGNTDPTDTLGNSGVLGSANLLANFTTATVTSELLLAIGGREWQASGSGTITSNLFDGLYDAVSIGGRAGGGGNFSGFFGAPGANGLPGGAGMTYGLFDAQGVSVSGAVVFGQPSP